MGWLDAGLALLGGVQAILAARVLQRLVATGGEPIRATTASAQQIGSVAVILPVLNEAGRLGPCLDGLMAQDATVAEILVVGGGSQDGTQQLVRTASLSDPRIRLVDASPVPADWNGKAWGLQVTLVQAAPLPLTLVLAARGSGRPLLLSNGLLLLVRFGVLFGMRRVYLDPPWIWWLSPLADFPVAARLWASILKRRQTWRGRALVT